MFRQLWFLGLKKDVLVMNRMNIWLSTESEMFLLEGDLEIPTNRNANKCTAKPRSCLWPKSGGKVIVPYLISTKYSRA